MNIKISIEGLGDETLSKENLIAIITDGLNDEDGSVKALTNHGLSGTIVSLQTGFRLRCTKGCVFHDLYTEDAAKAMKKSHEYINPGHTVMW